MIGSESDTGLACAIVVEEEILWNVLQSRQFRVTHVFRAQIFARLLHQPNASAAEQNQSCFDDGIVLLML